MARLRRTRDTERVLQSEEARRRITATENERSAAAWDELGAKTREAAEHIARMGRAIDVGPPSVWDSFGYRKGRKLKPGGIIQSPSGNSWHNTLSADDHQDHLHLGRAMLQTGLLSPEQLREQINQGLWDTEG